MVEEPPTDDRDGAARRFAEWWKVHGGRIERLVRLRFAGWKAGSLAGSEFCDEVLQQVSVKLREVGVDYLQQVLNIEGLVSGIAHRCAVGVWRDGRAGGLARAPRGGDPLSDLGSRTEAGSAAWPDHARQTDIERALAGAIGQVEAEHGAAGRLWIEVVLLRDYDGLTEQEVADRIGKALRSVQDYSYKGRRALRKALGTMGVTRAADLVD